MAQTRYAHAHVFSLDEATEFLQRIGYTVVESNAKYRTGQRGFFVKNSSGKLINPNPYGISSGSVIAQARLENDRLTYNNMPFGC